MTNTVVKRSVRMFAPSYGSKPLLFIGGARLESVFAGQPSDLGEIPLVHPVAPRILFFAGVRDCGTHAA